MKRSVALVLICVLAAVLCAPWRARGAESAPPVFLPIVLTASNLVPTDNLQVTAASYLGGAGADSLTGAAVAPDGSVVLGGSFPGVDFAGVLTTTVLPGASAGALLRLAPSGAVLRSVLRIGTEVSDLEVNDAGRIAVCGDFGVAALSPAGDTRLWGVAPGAATRCALAQDGSLAALVGGRVLVYGPDGAQIGDWSPGGTTASDLAFDSAAGLVIVAGYTQDDGGSCGPLQVAFLRAFSPAGQPRWAAYGWGRSLVGAAGLCADTRGVRVALGRDGRLYFAGTVNGGTGASIFSRDPLDLGAKLDGSRSVASDSYNTPSNVGSVSMTWFGRYRPGDGALEQGSSLLTRLSSGKGNSITPAAIGADEQGRVFLAGATACCLPGRERLTVGGAPVGTYESGEGFVLLLSADLRTRLHWTPLAGPAPASAGGAPVRAIDVRGGLAAAALTFSPGTGRGLITLRALQPAPAGASDGYVLIMPAR